MPPTNPIGRRAMLGVAIVATAAVARGQAMSRDDRGDMPPFAYVGCRTTRERGARGEGIQVYKMNPISGAWDPVQLVRGTANPSFLAFDRTERFLYAVHGDLSEISAFRVDPQSGKLAKIGRQDTGGRNPVHLTADPTNRFMIVANYATGTLAVLPRREDGSLGPVQQLLALPGEPGPNKVDQTASHPHQVAYDPHGRFLVVPDKGLDRVFTFSFDPAQGVLAAADPGFVTVPPGAGPRHVAFHPTAPYAFVANELGSAVEAYRYDAQTGALTPHQIVPSIPDTYIGANTAAEIAIAPSGRFVFVSNRGHDSIGCFAVDAATGRLTPSGWTPSGGKGPRFFAIDPAGALLHAANENGDTIVAFRVDADTGALTPTGQVVRTGSPVCIIFSTRQQGGQG